MDNRTTPANTRKNRTAHPARPWVRFIWILFAAALGATRADAQEAEGDLVYKFTVEGIHHRAEAKPLQYALFERATVHACDFIEECGCFKLASTVPLDYTTLNALLQETDNRLSGTVEVSDGSLLTPQQPLKR